MLSGAWLCNDREADQKRKPRPWEWSFKSPLLSPSIANDNILTIPRGCHSPCVYCIPCASRWQCHHFLRESEHHLLNSDMLLQPGFQAFSTLQPEGMSVQAKLECTQDETFAGLPSSMCSSCSGSDSSHNQHWTFLENAQISAQAVPSIWPWLGLSGWLHSTSASLKDSFGKLTAHIFPIMSRRKDGKCL